MKVLVTGSEGFVGKYLVKKLHEKKYDIYCIDKIDICRKQYFCHDLSLDIPNDLYYKLVNLKFDVIIHLAAAKGDYNLGYNDFYRDNVVASEKLINLVTDLSIKSVIMYSTVSVYGHNNKKYSEDAALAPNNAYGITKLESEDLFLKWFYLAPKKNNLTILRPSVIFGEDNFANMYNLIDQLNRRFPITVGNGNYVKSMVSVENIVDITLFCLNKIQGLQIYNCTDKPYPKLKNVINYITEIEGFSKPKIVIPKWFAYIIGSFFELFSFIINKDLGITRERIYKFTMSTDYRSEKLEKSGYVQRFLLKERLQNMASWYLKNKNK